MGSNPTSSAMNQSKEAMITADEAMLLALEEARKAAGEGEVPVGAVGVAGGEVVATGHNLRESSHDPTAHAEMLVLRQAAAARGSWRLDGLEFYVTLEPCLMCAGALLAARVSRLVYAAPDPKAGACGTLYNVCVDPRLNHEIPVLSGLMEDEASRLLSTFFAGRR